MSENEKQSSFGADAPGEVTIPEVTIQPYPTIKKGDRGASVAKWQRLIGVDADGNFGTGTDAATKAFQTAHGLTPDGVVGVKTWGAALDDKSPAGMLALEWNQASAELPSPPAPPAVIPPVPGAMPINPSAPVVVNFQKPNAPAGVKSPTVQVKPIESGMLGSLASAPWWIKGLAALGIGYGIYKTRQK